MEIWKPVEGFPQYLVSPEGHIRNTERDAPVKTRQNLQGIRMVNLMRDTKQYTRSVALIVAQAYLRPPPSPAYNSVIYLDGDKGNCEARNLMYRPRWYAVKYHQMFREEPLKVSVIIEETGEIFGTLREACVKYGLIEHYTYVDMLNGSPCFHYGYRFKRATGY